MITDLLKIDPSKECLKFLYKRVCATNYRGMQVSQHNRYDYDQVVGMLVILYNIAGTSKMKIRTSDLKKRTHNNPDELLYAQYTHLVFQKFNKGTQDSIRKNYFVDFHRMGLIDRFDKKNKEVSLFEKKPISCVALTKLGMELIDETRSLSEKYMIFSRALDNLLLGLATDMFDILAEFDYVTEQEFTFFVSFLRQKLDDEYFTLDKIMMYIKEYRSLSKYQRDAVVDVVQKHCAPTNFSGNKTDKRDYHNWINETQQIFMILGMTEYYQHNKRLKRIEFMVSPTHIFSSQDDVKKLKRSVLEKTKYFEKHGIKKQLGFELHHIIPLLWARNNTEFFLLDKWENMVYIDGKVHSIITQSGNKNARIEFENENDDILLIDSLDNKLLLKNSKNVLYSSALKDQMIAKNKELYSIF